MAVDALISASARALSAGDALGALQRIALRNDPPALALRGIAMAQLGEFERAGQLLRRALRGFGPRDELARARCALAEAEIALAMRRLDVSAARLDAAAGVLQSHGDLTNALYAQLVAARRWLMLGRVDDAAAALAARPVLPPGQTQPAALDALGELIHAEIAMRALRVGQAREAFVRAADAAAQSHIPSLIHEVQQAGAVLERACARCIDASGTREVSAERLSVILQSGHLVVDACRHGLVWGPRQLSLARRPVLFALLRALAEAAATGREGVARERLIADVFRTREGDETHRARLRVEMSRLRAAIASFARIESTAEGFALRLEAGHMVIVLVPLAEDEASQLLALMADGAAWSTSALAQALGRSQRSVQRALAVLLEEQRVRAIGSARARRWLLPPMSGFATVLLLPAALPIA